MNIPAEVVEHVRQGGIACDLCLKSHWQCGACRLPETVEQMIKEERQ